MSTKVEKDIVVDVPVRDVYDQWTQFEKFPEFMGGIQQVTQLADDRLEWVAEIGGVRRQWEARILEQTQDRKVAWAATEGATNAGAVTFQDLGDGRTSVHLELEYEPEGLVEKVGDKLNVVENQAEKDLERFKEFIESEGRATGAWRGSVDGGTTVGTPGVEHAADSRGDDGKAGLSGAAKAGLAAAAVGLAAGAAVAATRDGDSDSEGTSDSDGDADQVSADQVSVERTVETVRSEGTTPPEVVYVDHTEGVSVEDADGDRRLAVDGRERLDVDGREPLHQDRDERGL